MSVHKKKGRRSGWRRARAQIVEQVARAPVQTKTQGLGAEFKYDPKASDENLPRTSRTFWLEHIEDATKAEYLGAHQRRVKLVSIKIFYAHQVDAAELDVAIGEDYESIVDLLITPDNWDATESLIVEFTRGADLIFPASITRLEENQGVIQTISFPLEHLDE